MVLLSRSSNMTFVLPGDCNARCSFCSWRCNKIPHSALHHGLFLKNMHKAIDLGFDSYSVSGGEPTMSPIFRDAMRILNSRCRDRYVITTNGSYLDSIASGCSGAKAVNVSRHAVDSKTNIEIFGSRSVANVLELSRFAMTRGNPPMSLSVVLQDLGDSNTAEVELLEWIKFAKEVRAKSIRFRIESSQGMDCTHAFESLVAGIGYDGTTNACGVCRSTSFELDPPISFHYNKLETLVDPEHPHELILNQNGRLYSDWSGKHEVAFGDVKFIEDETQDVEEVEQKDETSVASETMRNIFRDSMVAGKCGLSSCK